MPTEAEAKPDQPSESMWDQQPPPPPRKVCGHLFQLNLLKTAIGVNNLASFISWLNSVFWATMK